MSLTLERRKHPPAPESESGTTRAAARVREWLALTELDYQVRAHGTHVVLGAGGKVVARLTALGHDAFGLSFPGPRGRWEMLFIDTLDEVMADLTSALEPARTG